MPESCAGGQPFGATSSADTPARPTKTSVSESSVSCRIALNQVPPFVSLEKTGQTARRSVRAMSALPAR